MIAGEKRENGGEIDLIDSIEPFSQSNSNTDEGIAAEICVEFD